jgi:hypothetical protein
VASLAKSHIHAQSVIGKKGAIAPADWTKATPEERAGFYQSVGGPSADKYEVKLPDGVKLHEEIVKGYKEQAFKSGVLPHQANELMGWFTKLDIDRQKATTKAYEESDKKAVDGLKTEWGDAFDRNLHAGVFFAKEVLGPEFVKLLNRREFGNNPTVLKALHAASKLLSQDKLREGGVGSGAPARGDIEAQLQDIRMSEAFRSQSHPNRASTMAKFESLAKMLTGGR